MSNQSNSGRSGNGGLSAPLVVLLGVLGLLVLIGGVGAGSYISANNQANSFEQRLKSQDESRQSIYAQYGQKVAEVAQVPAMYRDDLIKVTTAAIEGRYGKDGTKAVFQMLREQNPNLDPSLYRNVQQVIESGRSDIQTSQGVMIDTKRAYNTALGSFWTGLWMRVAGYPRIDLTKYVPITTDRAEEIFKTGKESAPIQLRPAQ